MQDKRRARIASAITSQLHDDVDRLYEELCDGDVKQVDEIAKALQSQLRAVRSDIKNQGSL